MVAWPLTLVVACLPVAHAFLAPHTARHGHRRLFAPGVRAEPGDGGNDGAAPDLTATLSKLASTPATALGVGELIDLEDALAGDDATAQLQRWLVRRRRGALLTALLRADRSAYLACVNLLGARLSRPELPNRQDVRVLPGAAAVAPSGAAGELVDDCTLANVTFAESPLDVGLLWVFRKLVQREIGWRSETGGILGLLEEGRHYMLSSEGTPKAQQQMVKNTLAGLMTPFLPPFYRMFMSGLVPSLERGDPTWLVDLFAGVRARAPAPIADQLAPGTQLGPWFYAPALTSFVTPTFFGFLVGPSTINRREDGSLGGLVVEKCKFLQESGCKGLCLNQCKLPAQSFFQDTLGLPLTVIPNFETQECQWSFGQEPAPLEEDPAWPDGCLRGCPTRSLVREMDVATERPLCG